MSGWNRDFHPLIYLDRQRSSTRRGVRDRETQIIMSSWVSLSSSQSMESRWFRTPSLDRSYTDPTRNQQVVLCRCEFEVRDANETPVQSGSEREMLVGPAGQVDLE
jgi:hypothetical protein